VKRSGSVVLDLLIVDLRGHVACPQASLGEAGATPLHNVEGARHLSKRDRHPVTASQVPAPSVSEPLKLADMETVPRRERIPSVSVQHSRVRGEVRHSWREREVVGGVGSILTDGLRSGYPPQLTFSRAGRRPAESFACCPWKLGSGHFHCGE